MGLFFLAYIFALPALAACAVELTHGQAAGAPPPSARIRAYCRASLHYWRFNAQSVVLWGAFDRFRRDVGLPLPEALGIWGAGGAAFLCAADGGRPTFDRLCANLVCFAALHLPAVVAAAAAAADAAERQASPAAAP